MTLQASGTISFSQIASEFSDTAPHAVSEFYSKGGLQNLEITAANLTSITSTWIGRGSRYEKTPRINFTSGSSKYLYYHQMWHDNGGTGRIIRTFTLDNPGEYYFGGGNYCQNGSRTGRHRIYINDVLQHDYNTSNSNNSFSGWSYREIETTDASDVIKIDCQWGSAGWGAGYQMLVGYETPLTGDPLSLPSGNSYSNVTPVLINDSIPTSGKIKFTDFYLAEDF
jgi:hypothetical protein